MKKFLIDEQQLQMLWNVLSEFPAGKVITAMDLIRNLPVLQEKEDESIVEENKPD